MVDSAYFVNSTPLRAFIGYFQHCADMLQTYEGVGACGGGTHQAKS